MVHNLYKTLILLFLFLIGFLPLKAQYNNIRFDHISLANGLSQSSVNCILQDSKGFMWFGTQDGLNRYDGYSFTVYRNDLDDSSSISNNFIHCLFEDKQGAIWAGTELGISVFHPTSGTFTHYYNNPKVGPGLSSNSILSIIQDVKGTMWVGTTDGGLNHLILDNYILKTVEVFKKENSPIFSNGINCLLDNKDGTIWIGTTDGGLTSFNSSNKQFINYTHSPKNVKSISDNQVWNLFPDGNNLWVATNNGLDLFNTKSKMFSHFIHKDDYFYSLSNNAVKCVYKDNSDNVWIGTLGGGLNRYDAKTQKFTHYDYLTGIENGISSNTIQCIEQDKTGTLWIGTENGLNKFDKVKQGFKHYQQTSNLRHSISSNQVWSIWEDKDANLWIATKDGLDKFSKEDQAYTHYVMKSAGDKSISKDITYVMEDKAGTIWLGAEKGLCYLNKVSGEIILFKPNKNIQEINNKKVYIIFEDKNKNLWMGTKEGLLVLDKSREKMFLYQSQQGSNDKLSANNVRCISQDAKGRIWIGTNGGGLCKVVFKDKEESDISKLSFIQLKSIIGNIRTINNDGVLAIFPDENDVLWLGTFGGGLNKLDVKTGEFEYFTERNGLSNNVIYGILKDEKNNLWLSTNKGISRFNTKTKEFRNYYENDGLQSNEFNTGAYFKSNSGEMFFGGINGFNAFFPDFIQTNTIPPDVVITDFKVFNKSIKPGKKSILKASIYATQEITLSYKENFFSFEYAALHYSSPEKNVYKFMMEGLDEDWNFVGNRRQAYYTNLEPGEYTFKLMAANSDGVWSDKIVSVKIIITPPIWKRLWFRVLLVLLLFVIVYAWYRTRIYRIESVSNQLEIEVKERTSELEIEKSNVEEQKNLLQEEKDKVEKLLLNILPSETVDELKNKGKASARHYRSASVMFTDFKGFTKISETLRPKELVEELDRYFIKFDEIIAKYDIEKIKTIGDAYMCVGGVPLRNKSNPVDIILAALEIQRYLRELKVEREKTGEACWEVRIGIHTGELIAGVVGIKRFAYDVWGDTVNVASRMEATSLEGKVNISGTTYQVAKEFFVCTYRGKVQAKNKGEIDMYFVESIKPELSENGEGIVPNQNFADRLDHVLYSNINYKKAEQYIVKMLSEQLPPGLFYHGLHHTLDVCKSAENIANNEGVEGEDLYVLKTAALFHDAGFTKEYVKNEPIGVAMAKETLPQFGYSEKQMEMIEKIIMSTQIPQKASTILEKIMCDADLDYLGRDDFHQIADSLKNELMAFGKIQSDKQWDEIQIPFLEKHSYFTEFSIKNRQPFKEQRIAEIKKRLKEDKYSKGL